MPHTPYLCSPLSSKQSTPVYPHLVKHKKGLVSKITVCYQLNVGILIPQKKLQTKLVGPEKLNMPKNILFKRRPFPFLCDSKRPHSECRLMYTGADTCCQQPYALAVTCDHPQHPPVIYNSAGTNMEEEQSGESSECAEETLHTNRRTLTYILR